MRSEDLHVVLEPDVRLIARNTPDVEALDKLLHAYAAPWPNWEIAHGHSARGGGDALAEFAGRVCYWSFGDRGAPRTTDAYIERLIQQGHGSVLEHATFTLFLAGVSRALSHELVRHRVGVAISQLSQRFVDDVEFLRVVMPPVLVADTSASGDIARQTWKYAMAEALTDYAAELRVLQQNVKETKEAKGAWTNPRDLKKSAAEAARSILPNAVETRLVWTINARSARSFLVKRGGVGVDAEMRRFAVALANVLLSESPALFPDVRVEAHGDGALGVTVAHGAV